MRSTADLFTELADRVLRLRQDDADDADANATLQSIERRAVTLCVERMADKLASVRDLSHTLDDLEHLPESLHMLWVTIAMEVAGTTIRNLPALPFSALKSKVVTRAPGVIGVVCGYRNSNWRQRAEDVSAILRALADLAHDDVNARLTRSIGTQPPETHPAASADPFDYDPITQTYRARPAHPFQNVPSRTPIEPPRQILAPKSATLSGAPAESVLPEKARGMPWSEAEIKVREYLAKHGSPNRKITVREIAKAIGARSTSTISKSQPWQAYHKRWKEEHPPAPKTLALTETMESLIAEQTNDRKSDAHPIRARRRSKPGRGTH